MIKGFQKMPLVSDKQIIQSLHIKDQFIQILGKGGEGMVILFKRQSQNVMQHQEQIPKSKYYCIKVRLVDAKHYVHIIREHNIIKTINHPNLVQYEIQQNRMYNLKTLVSYKMDYANCGTLADYMKTHNLKEDQLLSIFIQILLALDNLKQHKIIHRDIKPNNILLNKENGFLLVKVSDYGLSKKLINDKEVTGTVCGTLNYMSPEILSNSKYNFLTDIYSLGLVLYFLLENKQAFKCKTRGELRYCQQYQCLQFTNKYSPVLKKLCLKMTQKNPKDRPTIIEIIQEPLIYNSLIQYSSELQSMPFFSQKYEVLKQIASIISQCKTENTYEQKIAYLERMVSPQQTVMKS